MNLSRIYRTNNNYKNIFLPILLLLRPIILKYSHFIYSHFIIYRTLLNFFSKSLKVHCNNMGLPWGQLNGSFSFFKFSIII